jgi:hypothetical protein
MADQRCNKQRAREAACSTGLAWLRSRHRLLPYAVGIPVILLMSVLYGNLIHSGLMRHRRSERADLHYLSSKLFWDGFGLKASLRFQNLGKNPVLPNALIIRNIAVQPPSPQFDQNRLFAFPNQSYGSSTMGVEIASMQTIPIEAEYHSAILPCEPSGAVPCDAAKQINNREMNIHHHHSCF